MKNKLGIQKNLFIVSVLAPLACWAPMSFGEDAGTLSDFVNQVRAIESIHLRASVDIRIFDSDGKDIGPAGNGAVVEGTYALWMSGDKYRIDSFMDPALYPGMITTLAYDGARFQMLLGDSGILTASSQDTDAAAMTLPNPVVEMLPFMAPLDDDTADRRVRLKDLSDRIPRVDLIADVEWEPIKRGFMAVEQLERAILPGGVYKEIAYDHHVYATPGRRDRPIRIDRVMQHGQVWTSTEFSHYFKIVTNEGVVTHWPRHLAFKGYNSEGELGGQMTYTITSLELNEPIDSGVFTLDRNHLRVWDEDIQQFVE